MPSGTAAETRSTTSSTTAASAAHSPTTDPWTLPTSPIRHGSPAWLAADNLLSLLATAPDRIRQCAHPDCVLFFYDTSKNGTRRWHSMATCGNRTKAARHYAKKN